MGDLTRESDSPSTEESLESKVHQEQNIFSPLLFPSIELDVDTLIKELRSSSEYLTEIARCLNRLNRLHIQASDRIQVIERRTFDLIHNPPTNSNPLDRSCAIATLMYIRSNMRDNVCNFRVVDTGKLKGALRSLLELADLWKCGMDARSQEKLVWTVGFGAVSSGDKPERPWFVRFFKDLCKTLRLRRWDDVKIVFETVLWRDDLDDEGIKLWEEAHIITG